MKNKLIMVAVLAMLSTGSLASTASVADYLEQVSDLTVQANLLRAKKELNDAELELLASKAQRKILNKQVEEQINPPVSEASLSRTKPTLVGSPFVDKFKRSIDVQNKGHDFTIEAVRADSPGKFSAWISDNKSTVWVEEGDLIGENWRVINITKNLVFLKNTKTDSTKKIHY